MLQSRTVELFAKEGVMVYTSDLSNVETLQWEDSCLVSQRKISSKTLNRFLCVIVGGLAAEHLVFGYSKGLHSDVEKVFDI
ncbi:hypothetical protein RJ639_035629 [Escallonia herrerae]|uniref:Uncharacterized protein n=1 Tax=Escallonia herrerae TaxID=1293975 RepID=A0AA88WQ03_9ASTE|nr:hypothetical protein RJ639_035629 [Escallonia herrerae]